MPTYVFTSGEYSNYGLSDIWRRDRPATQEEFDRINQLSDAAYAAAQAMRTAAWTALAASAGVPVGVPYNMDAAVREKRRAVSRAFDTEWAKLFPDSDFAGVLLEEAGFERVEYVELFEWKLSSQEDDDGT